MKKMEMSLKNYFCLLCTVFPLIMGFLGNKGKLFTSDAKLMFKARCFGIISESDDEDQKLISFSQLHENRSKA